MGWFDWMFNGKEILPQATPYHVPFALEPFADWMMSPFTFNEEAGTWEMRGAPGYPGQLSPDINQTRLPEVWNSWQPWDGGMQHIAGMLGKMGPTQQNQQYQNNVMQYGGPGGYPTQMMSNMIQFGGTGGKGHLLMDNLTKYGVTNKEVGQPVSNIMQFGVASEAGRPYQERAFTGNNAASQHLLAYGKPAPRSETRIVPRARNMR